MRLFLGIVLYFYTQPIAAGEDIQARVNYHLKSVQTRLEKNHSQSKVNALKSSEIDIAEDASPYNDPHYGIGTDYKEPDIAVPTHTREPSFKDDYEARSFVEEFKQNAARKGVRVEVDPVTLSVREVR